MEKNRNETIDLLKCYAALLVFVCHAYIISNEVFGYKFTSSWQFILKTPAWAGVWIFMMLSGFLAGFGFLSGRYELDGHSIFSYYKDRFKSVLLPTWIMISLVHILADPQLTSLEVVARYLTCMFRGSGAANGVGATWYVFSLAWLYLLTPLFVCICRWIENKWTGREKSAYTVLFCILAVLGLAYRVGGRLIGLEWYRWIYASPIGNIDLFLGGMIVLRIRYFAPVHDGKRWRRVSLSLTVAASLVCAFCYFYGETTKPVLLSFYRYMMPTVYLILVGGCSIQKNIRSKQDGAKFCILEQLIHFNSICGIH